MKRDNKSTIFILAALMISLFVGAGCSRKTLISDEKLAQIFHDAFLANAYTSNAGISLDSLRLYEPIFQNYGYTTEDVQYTIGSFSTRKSARLSDVVERSIAMLEERGLELDKHVEVLKSLDKMALKHATQTIYSDSLLEYRSLKDSTKMRVVIENPRHGSYHIKFRYLVDSLDTTKRGYKSSSWLEKDQPLSGEALEMAKDKDSTKIVKFNATNSALKREEVATLERTVTIDRLADRFIIEVLSTDEIEGGAKSSKPTYHATIKSLEITLTPEIEQAREDLFMELVGIKIFDNELLIP